jgi:antitoxin CptB
MTTTSHTADSPDIRLRKLRYRSWHRGCKETDVILGNFADQALHTLHTPEELDAYEALLDEQDIDIWNWLSGSGELADGRYEALRDRLTYFARSEQLGRASEQAEQ